MGEITKDRHEDEGSASSRAPLLPVRHAPDFFVCDLFDAAPKGDMASMEHPIFSLSTKPDTRPRRYEHNGRFVEIIPSVLGLATVHDRDVLIFCISQIMAALNEGRTVSQVVRFKAHDLLTATNRMTDGQGYRLLKDALERLGGTRISTDIITGGQEVWENFGLIENSKIVRKTRNGRMIEVEIKLSDWVFNAIRAKEVLTLHRDYFRLRRPLERRIYELARKHCGRQDEWRIGLDVLQKKCGSSSTLREFRRLVGEIVEQDQQHGHMPDYALALVDDVLTVTPRRPLPDGSTPSVGYDAIWISEEGYQAAKRAAPGWDVYHLEREWKGWMHKNQKAAPRVADAAFAKWCAKYAANHGKP